MSFYLSAILLGLGFATLAMGIFISMRIFNFPDITTDGTFTLGGALTAVLISSGLSPWTGMIVVFFCRRFSRGLHRINSHEIKSKCSASRNFSDDCLVFCQPCNYGPIEYSIDKYGKYF